MRYPQRYTPDYLPETGKVTEVLKQINIGFLIGASLGFIMNYAQLPSDFFYDFGRGETMFPKWYLIVIPLVMFLFYFGIRWHLQKPHLINYPAHLTKENYPSQYRLASVTIWSILFLTNLVLFMIYMDIKSGGYYKEYTILPVIGYVVVIGYSIYRSFKLA